MKAIFHSILLVLSISGQIEAKIAEDVISTTAGLAALEVSGVAGIPSEVITGVSKLLPKSQVGKRVKVEVKDDRLIIDVPVVIYYGFSIPTVVERIKMRVKDKIEHELGLEVGLVNVLVEGIQILQGRKKEEEMEMLKISPEVISTIAGVAALEVEGVVGIPEEIIAGVPKILERPQVSKAVHIEIEDKKVEVKVPVIVFEDMDIKELVKEIQDSIKKRIEQLTDLEVSKVSVEVKGVQVSFRKKEEERIPLKEIKKEDVVEKEIIQERIEKPQMLELLEVEKEMEDLKGFLSRVKKVVEKSGIDPAKETFRKADMFFEMAQQAMNQKDYNLSLKFIKRAKGLALQAIKITELKELEN
ncbi:MAG: Asp23/Gls24 family envelope stress response protein [bacterium]|nr:Asp23/Gls24 family envelope stress response protein [bacterium]